MVLKMVSLRVQNSDRVLREGDAVPGHKDLSEMTKLTQELAVKLEQGRDLRQWHSMAN